MGRCKTIKTGVWIETGEGPQEETFKDHDWQLLGNTLSTASFICDCGAIKVVKTYMVKDGNAI